MSLPSYALRDGNTIPAIGLGTYGLNEQPGIEAISTAIEDGYRLLDTAYNYGNEDVVGEAIRRSGVDRSDLFVATKLPGRHHGFDETIASFEESRARLDLDWLDLYLIHWPNPSVDKFVDSWKAMIRLREKGLVRSIGVSNFTAPMLERLERETGVVPSVNQVELRAFHDEHGIRTESWSPLGRKSDLLDEPVLGEIAARLGRTVPQVVLRWHVQLGSVPIPKSSHAERRRANLDVFSFELGEADLAAIGALERGRIWGADPDTHEEL